MAAAMEGMEQHIFGDDKPQDDLPEEFLTMSADDIQRRCSAAAGLPGCRRRRSGGGGRRRRVGSLGALPIAA